MAWRWTAHRVLVSAFLLWHVGASIVAVMPPSPVKERAWPAVSRYIFPLGLWQAWSMFSPNPFRQVPTLEAEVVDAQGLRREFAFPHAADNSLWRSVPRFRYMKYNTNLIGDGVDPLRRCAASHVVRSLKVPASAFPVDVHLYFKLRDVPPPGALDDPMAPTRYETLATFTFASPDEVWR